MNLREHVKQLRTIAAAYSGWAWLNLAFRFRNRALVLMYHRVLPENRQRDVFSADAIVVTPETFELHMKFLRRFCNPVSIQEFRAMMYGEAPWRPRTCLVTFDDGWFDNASYALPILERSRVPATVFVATGYVGTDDTFWQERLMRLLHAAHGLGERSRPLFEELQAGHLLQIANGEVRKELRALITSWKTLSRNDVNALIGRVEEHLRAHGIDNPGVGTDRFMNWQETASLARSGLVAVESHAHSHTPLTAIEHAAVRNELVESRQQLQAQLGKPVRYLAYPNGNHDLAIAGIAREAGYELAFTTESGLVYPGDDPLRVRRINISEQGTNSVAGFLCRVLAWW